jgi:hypothetical protein
MRYPRLAVKVVFAVGVLVSAITMSRCASTGEGDKDAPKDKPIITITEAPDETVTPGSQGRGTIAGTVSGVKPEDHRVVIYALGDVWYVQPLESSPPIRIDANGKWTSWTHGGYQYAAFLVKSSYKPAAKTEVLPEVAGDVLAADKVKPAKKGEKIPQR